MSKDKEHSALRKTMSKLDCAIPDYVFVCCTCVIK